MHWHLNNQLACDTHTMLKQMRFTAHYIHNCPICIWIAPRQFELPNVSLCKLFPKQDAPINIYLILFKSREDRYITSLRDGEI